MTDKKPYLFLDIDGVLNTFGGNNVWGDDEEHWVTPAEELGGGRSYLITISPSLGKAIMDLDVELWWTTTWQTEAWNVGDLVGIKGQTLPLYDYSGWKRGAVERKLNEDPRPFLWFEDDDTQRGTWNMRGFKHFPPYQIFNTDPMLGITPKAIDIAAFFLEELRNGNEPDSVVWNDGGGTMQPMRYPSEPLKYVAAELDDNF